MSPGLLEVKDVVAGYGGLDVLAGVSLQVAPDEIVCVIGPNGAGKSTLLKALIGLADVRSGVIRLDGREISRLPVRARIAQGLSYVPQGRNLFPRMSVERNLTLAAHGLPRWLDVLGVLEQVYARFPLLRERRQDRAADLSGGQLQLLQMARALMGRPRLVLLDEPTLGLSPLLTREVFGIVREIHRHGVAILMVEQNAARALEIAHRAYVLDLGRNRCDGLAADIRSDPRVRELYLGGR